MCRRNRLGIALFLSLATSALPGGVRAEADPQLAQRGYDFLKKHCYGCHGVKFERPGLNVLDRDVLIAMRKKPFLTPGKPAESLLFKRIDSDDMPPEEIKERPTAEEKKLFKEWIEAGAPFPERERRAFKSDRDVLTAIRDDLRRTPQADRRFQRYFTLAHLYNNKTVTEADMRLYRAALGKLANSLSWEPELHVPRPVDKEETVFAVDLRKLGWDKQDLWQEILRQYPYGLKLSQHRDEAVRELAQEVYDLSSSNQPYLRADWFIASAARPPLYHTLLELPKNATELEKKLNVNVIDNFLNNKLARGGFTTSGVSKQNRLVERHPAAHGAYWKSYDFKSSEGAGNLILFPLGPDFKDHPYPRQVFKHDGGEIIFHLPNGLQGYLLTDAKDERIDKGPIEIVRDLLETSGTPEIVNGLSCMACHRHGMIRFKDALRDGHGLADEKRVKMELLFPKAVAMDRLLQRDEDRFLRAADDAMGPFLKVGSDENKDLRDFPEPIGAVARLYVKDLGPEEVALELGLSEPEKLKTLLQANRKLRETLGLGPLIQGNAIKRETWHSLEGLVSPFQEAARELDLGTPLRVQ